MAPKKPGKIWISNLLQCQNVLWWLLLLWWVGFPVCYHTTMARWLCQTTMFLSHEKKSTTVVLVCDITPWHRTRLSWKPVVNLTGEAIKVSKSAGLSTNFHTKWLFDQENLVWRILIISSWHGITWIFLSFFYDDLLLCTFVWRISDAYYKVPLFVSTPAHAWYSDNDREAPSECD